MWVIALFISPLSVRKVVILRQPSPHFHPALKGVLGSRLASALGANDAMLLGWLSGRRIDNFNWLITDLTFYFHNLSLSGNLEMTKNKKPLLWSALRSVAIDTRMSLEIQSRPKKRLLWFQVFRLPQRLAFCYRQ
jgi:hypothetical protein